MDGGEEANAEESTSETETAEPETAPEGAEGEGPAAVDGGEDVYKRQESGSGSMAENQFVDAI